MRKKVKARLESLGIFNRFTLRAVGFSDLARGQGIFCRLLDWKPSPLWFEAKRELHEIGVILEG
jgi:hypothetical protein